MRNLLQMVKMACVLISAAVSAHAQGTLNFSNFVRQSGVDAPVIDALGNRLAGSQYIAVLLLGESLTPVPGIAAVLRNGTGAGYFLGGAVDIGVPAGSLQTIRVGVFDTTSGIDFASATIKAISNPVTILTGGAGAPPSLPPDLVGLTNFRFVPEPSAIALGILGTIAWWGCRRRK